MAFMETIDNLRDKVVAAGKDVSEKAKEAAAIAKLQTQISVEKSKLKGLYTDLGKAYYEDGVNMVADYEAAVNGVSSDDVKALAKRLLDEKSMVKVVMRPEK